MTATVLMVVTLGVSGAIAAPRSRIRGAILTQIPEMAKGDGQREGWPRYSLSVIRYQEKQETGAVDQKDG
jgi:hypothetical protein